MFKLRKELARGEPEKYNPRLADSLDSLWVYCSCLADDEAPTAEAVEVTEHSRIVARVRIVWSICTKLARSLHRLGFHPKRLGLCEETDLCARPLFRHDECAYGFFDLSHSSEEEEP